MANARECAGSSPVTLCSRREANAVLADRHYLGPVTHCYLAWKDEFGVMVWAHPRSRYLPHGTWLELIRWCLYGDRNGGSRQWGRFRRWARAGLPATITTLVSYSDPSQGHSGALYKACNWTWEPTWHRLRPPPSGHGAWSKGNRQEVKDRWIFPLRPDEGRAEILRVKDSAAVRRMGEGAFA